MCRVWGRRGQRLRAARRHLQVPPIALALKCRGCMEDVHTITYDHVRPGEAHIEAANLHCAAGPAVSITPLAAGPAVTAALTVPTPAAFFPLAGDDCPLSFHTAFDRFSEPGVTPLCVFCFGSRLAYTEGAHWHHACGVALCMGLISVWYSNADVEGSMHNIAVT